ncbi:MAG: hypothetical protein V4723_07490 [Pseudomonadota bacterium]
MLTKQGQYWYGEGQADIHDEIKRYSKLNGYPAQQFADALCKCGSNAFRLSMDEVEGAAVRECDKCAVKHPIGDSEEYLDNAELIEYGCPCGNDDLEISIGVSLFDNSKDVRWLYLGCRCPKCKLTAVYGDWKNEVQDYSVLLQKV